MNVQHIVSRDDTDDWRKFASMMFRLEDADPGYMLLKRAELSYEQKLRYVLAWCTYYNPGIAAIASAYKGKKFYEYLHSVYGVAQRASERRHFRGQAGYKALTQWQAKFPAPEDMIEACYSKTYLGVRKNMQDMAQMGDYFYWKLADIWDTVFNYPVDFTGCEKYMPKVPKQGAELIHNMTFKHVSPAQHTDPFWLADTMKVVTDYVAGIKYPVKDGRKLALQEAETVCCVFKQHVAGDYHYGYRSAKAYKRLVLVRKEAPATVGSLLNGLYAGGIWSEDNLKDVLFRMSLPKEF
jgi:hypothetical protein